MRHFYNDKHCEKCHSNQLVAPYKKVLVKSTLGLLGDLEGKEVYLQETDFDIKTKTNYAIVSDIVTGKQHKIALEHIHEYPINETVSEVSSDNKSDFKSKLKVILSDLENLLVAKNQKYGNSALEPIRVFSKASPSEQILVRLDDKLSRLRTQHISEDEDVLMDLIGYLLLLKMSMRDSK